MLIELYTHAGRRVKEMPECKEIEWFSMAKLRQWKEKAPTLYSIFIPKQYRDYLACISNMIGGKNNVGKN